MGAPYLKPGLLALLCACLLIPAQPFAADPAPAQGQTPAAKPKPKLPPLPAPVRVGDMAPDFELTDTSGAAHRLSDYTAQGKIVVLEWFSPACPVCVAYYTAEDGGMSPMASIHEGLGEDVVWLCVNSSAPGKPGSDMEQNVKSLSDLSIHFPLLLDKSGRIGQAYGARVTPHLMVIGADGKLYYRGAADSGGRDAIGTGQNFIAEAVASSRNGRMPMVLETQAFG